MSLERAALDAAERAGRTAADAPAGVTRAVLDAFSVAVPGSASRVVGQLTEALEVSGAGPSPVWFSGGAALAGDAALLNGAAIHVNDFDDTHDAAIVHCMSVILPAAYAGWRDGRTDTLLSAVAAGTELACNLALARPHYSGWHYTTLLGAMGAALAHATAAGAPDEVVADAVGNAYVHLGGNKQVVLDASVAKRLMPGTSARAGVLASRLAHAGIGGVRGWLGGEYGLLTHYYGSDRNKAEVHGGERPRIDELSLKPYPACRFTHGAIEAALLLRERLGAETAAGLERVRVRYPATDRFGIVVRPFESRGAAEMDAQFSTAFLVASALVHGRIDFESYGPGLIDDPTVVDLAGRVDVVQDVEVDDSAALGPIEVEGSGASITVETVLGAVGRPLGAELARAKFETCRSRAVALGTAAERLPTYDELADALETADGTTLRNLVAGRPRVGTNS
ncbi:MmgE/PrpD family protein [Pseudonocardia ailaonensis]